MLLLQLPVAVVVDRVVLGVLWHAATCCRPPACMHTLIPDLDPAKHYVGQTVTVVTDTADQNPDEILIDDTDRGLPPPGDEDYGLFADYVPVLDEENTNPEDLFGEGFDDGASPILLLAVFSLTIVAILSMHCVTGMKGVHLFAPEFSSQREHGLETVSMHRSFLLSSLARVSMSSFLTSHTLAEMR